MSSSGTAELLHFERLVSRVEQKAIDLVGETQGLLDGLGTGYVNDLHQSDTGQFLA